MNKKVCSDPSKKRCMLKMARYLLQFCTLIVEDVEISSHTFAQLSLKMLRYLLTLLHNYLEDVEISSYTFAQLSLKMLISLLTLLHTYRWRCWLIFLHFWSLIVEDVEISSYTFAQLSLKMLRYLLTLLHNYLEDVEISSYTFAQLSWRCWDIFLHFCTLIVEDVEISFLHFLTGEKKFWNFYLLRKKTTLLWVLSFAYSFMHCIKISALAVSKRQSSRTFAQNDISSSSVSIQRYTEALVRLTMIIRYVIHISENWLIVKA